MNLNPRLPPISRRDVLTFGALVVLLLAPWPGLGRIFAAGFAAFATGVVRVFGIGGDAAPRFLLPGPGEVGASDGGDWAVVLAAGSGPALPLDTRILGYTPFALFLAITLATDVARRRRAVILGAGLAVLALRLAIGIAIPVARAFGAPGSASPLGELAWITLFTPPAMSYATPLLVWWLAVAWTTPPPVVTQSFPSRRRGRS